MTTLFGKCTVEKTIRCNITTLYIKVNETILDTKLHNVLIRA